MKRSSLIHLVFPVCFPLLLAHCAQKTVSKDAAPPSSEVEEAGGDVGEGAAEGDAVVGEGAPADAVDVDEDAAEGSAVVAPQKVASKPLPKDKANLKDKIVDVENEALGDAKKKTLGLFGDLKACRAKLASKAYGGDGTLFWDEPGDRLSEKWLTSADTDIKEFQAVLLIVRYRRDYLKSEWDQCQQKLQSLKPDPAQSLAVTITEGDSDNDDRVHQYMCRFVKKGASLKDFLLQTFSRGILQLENFDLSQEFLVAPLKDEKGVSYKNGLMFMGWKLSFDQGPLNLKEIIFDNKDAKLEHWAFVNKDKVADKDSCLPKAAGLWNP
jgi:hypothetical protein